MNSDSTDSLSLEAIRASEESKEFSTHHNIQLRTSYGYAMY